MRRLCLAVVALAVALTMLLPVAADATTYVVDRFDDPAVAGACTVAANDCSLNQALALADVAASPDTVQLAAGTYDNGHGSNASNPVTIVGAGARATTIKPSMPGNPVFSASNAGTATLEDLTLTGGSAGGPSFGGGVYLNATSVVLRRVAVLDNRASGDPQFGSRQYYGAGAGLRMNTSGDATIEDSVIAGNRALSGSTGVGAVGGGCTS